MSAFDKWYRENGQRTDFYGNYTTTFRDCWDAAIKHAEALKPSHNTVSPKLPELYAVFEAVYGPDIDGKVLPSCSSSVDKAYKVIARQLRAGAQ